MAKKKNNNLLIIILVVAVLGLIGFAAWRARMKPKGEKVTVEEVAARTIKEEVAASGKIFPQTEVAISSDVSGEIVELLVEEGDSVISGQLLAKIDPDAFQSQVERGEASVNSSKAQLANSRSQVENAIAQKEQILAQLENAREIHERNEELYKDGVISEADYETTLSNLRGLEANLRASEASIKAAQQSVKAAEYNVKSAEASLKELRTSLKRTSIYAPISGIISSLSVEQGERVVGTIQMSGTEMLRIADLNAMEVRVEVSEADIPRVSVGDVVNIEVDAYIDRTFNGKVTQIANSATNSATATSLTSDQVTNFEVRINIDPGSYTDLISPQNRYPFRPGMSASVDINTETRSDILSVPIQVVTTREREEEDLDEEEKIMEVVFVAMEGDTVNMVEVVTGIQNNDYIEIKSGLEAGQSVVTGPYTVIARELEQGDAIRTVKSDELFAEKE